jgi:hypothetical protein
LKEICGEGLYLCQWGSWMLDCQPMWMCRAFLFCVRLMHQSHRNLCYFLSVVCAYPLSNVIFFVIWEAVLLYIKEWLDLKDLKPVEQNF